VSKQVFFKWFKRATLVLGIIPILLFLAFAGAVSFIDFNQYKPQIEQEVTHYTGREFKIEGVVDVSVFPFELSASELVLKNPEGFESPNLLSVKTVQVELSLWSLLWHKEMNVLRLELVEPELHLIKNQVGDNWSDIKGVVSWLPRSDARMQSGQITPQTATEWFESLQQTQVNFSPEAEVKKVTSNEVTQADVSAITHWEFDSLVIRNGKIQVYDKVQGFAETLLNINILTFDVVKNHPFDISSDFTYQNSLSQRMYDVHLNGTLAVKNQFTVWQLTQWNGVFKVRLPEDQQVPEIRLATRGELFEFEFETSQITVENGFLSGLDAQLESNFSGQFGFNTLLSGTVTLKQLNFKEWAKHLKIPLPKFVNQQALSVGNGQFEWYWDGAQLLLNDIDVEIDKSKLQGDVSYNFEDTHSLRFELSLHAFNVDFYQAYLPTEGGGEKNIEPKKVYLPAPISVSFLRQANVFGGLNLTQLTVHGINMDTLETEVLVEQGVLQLAPFDVTLYQGELLSRLHIDLTDEQPSFHWKGRINHLALEELAKLPPSPFLLGGTLVSRFDLTTTGAQLETVKSNLNGRLSLTLEGAKLAGVDLNKVLAGELDLTPADSSETYTELQNITLVGRWSDGVYSARKLDVASERFSASGAGTFDVNTATIDTTLNVLIKHPKGGGEIFKGLNLPMTYRGVLQANTPSEQAIWQVDVANIMNSTELQKQLIQGLLSAF
jgi:AsmA protein